jgi:hypothetical protein
MKISFLEIAQIELASLLLLFSFLLLLGGGQVGVS